MSKYCVNCGDGLPQGAAVCANCGMPVSELAPPRPAPALQASTQAPPPLSASAEENVPPFWQPHQDQPSASSHATAPSSASDEDQYEAEPRRGVSRWVARTAGFVGTAAATLVGTVAFWRQGTDALELKSYADSAAQQDMGMSEAPVQDPASSDQIEGNLDSVGKIVPAAAATRQDGPELTLDPSLTDPTAPGPTLEVSLIDQVEKVPDLVNVVNRNPELVDAINEDPEFIELCQLYPEFIELCEQYPDFLYLCYHYPQFIQLCYQYPQFIQLCYEYPQFIDVCYDHPQFIQVCREYPEFFEKHPEIVEAMEDNPNLVELMQTSPTVLQTLDENPNAVEAIKANPDVVDVIQQNPRAIGQIHQDPAFLDDLVTTAAESKPSPVDEPAKTDSGESTLDADLFDPTAPGPTLDTGLVKRIEQNPELVEAVNRNEAVARALERDPASVDQIEQDLGIADQRPVKSSTVTGQADDPEPEILEAGLPSQDLDDQPSP